MKKNTAQRRANHVKQGRMEIVAELYKKGWTIRSIVEEVKNRMNLHSCSTRTIHKDIAELLKEWRESRITDIDSRLQLELAKIDDCERELWQQWEKSKEDWLREHNRKIGVPTEELVGGGDGSIKTVRRENDTVNVVGLGNPAYISEIRQQHAERRKLLGLYESTKIEVSGTDIAFPTLTKEDIETLKSINGIK